MFGYVIVNQKELSENQFNRYRSFYCGLCESLKQKYGQLCRITVNYDMTFVALVLNSLYEVKTRETEKHCPIHPLRKVKQIHNEILDYCADMTIILAYYKMLDDLLDEKRKPVYYKKLETAFQSVRPRYSEKIEIIEKRLSHIHLLEQNKCSDIDEISGDFGDIMAEIFVYKEDEWSIWLGKMGFYLGKFIYLMDAYDDLEKDLKMGLYNPFEKVRTNENFEQVAYDILESMVAECVKPCGYLPLVEDTEIIENVLYSGVWTRYNLMHSKKKGV